MSYIGQGLPADTFQGFVTDSFTGDGSATTFTLSKEPFSEDTLIVVINNVIQKPTTNFTVSGTTLTIVGTAVADGDVIYAIHMGGPLPIGGASELDLNGASDKLILDLDGDTTISADTDDQIDFKLGGTDFMSLTTTGATITTADNNAQLTLTSTDADASAGPVLKLTRDSGSPADDDFLGNIQIEMDNDAGENLDAVSILAQAKDVSDASEDARLYTYVRTAGSMRDRFSIAPSETVFNEDSVDVDFRVESDGQTHALFVDAGNNRVNIGSTTDVAATLVVADGDSGQNSPSANANTFVIEKNDNCGLSILAATNAYSSIHFGDSGDTDIGQIFYNHSADTMEFHANATQIFTIHTSGVVFNEGSNDQNFRVESNGNTHAIFVDAGADFASVGKNTDDGDTLGHFFGTNGAVNHCRSGANVMAITRNTDDGNLMTLRQAGTTEGSISVSGSTVSFNGFTGSHLSRLADNSKPTILRGTIMETIDEMCEWYQAVADIAESKDEEGNVIPAHKKRESIALPEGKSVGDAVTFTSSGVEYTGVYEKETDVKHTKSKVSDTEDSKKVYGVFHRWDDADDGLDGDVNDMEIAQVGTYIIRVNKDVTVEAGDLLVSNGDGTAKKQDDDIIRSKTVAKVNSNIKVETYSDGSYTVPCTLHC